MSRHASPEFHATGLLGRRRETIEKGHNDTLQANFKVSDHSSLMLDSQVFDGAICTVFIGNVRLKEIQSLAQGAIPTKMDQCRGCWMHEDIKAEKVKTRDAIRKVEKDNLDLVRDTKKDPGRFTTTTRGRGRKS